ncbi:MAG: hypothetical protein IT423_01820 [Pirellulaceae bacterium]|nr:hypothetical protein [Pirellulaceae bacterium]
MGQDNANEQPPPPPPTFWQRLAERVRNTAGSGLAFALIPLLILGYLGWYYYGAEHLDQTLYGVKLENIELTPQPPWIHSNLKEQVYRENGLSEVSLLEPEATATIAHAFDANTWIKSTNQVRKMSGGKVVVDVTYRRPVAMVFQSPPPGTGNGKGLCYPVDEEGSLLPTDEFSPSEVLNYFMIFAENAAPSDTAFRDPRILEALQLVRLLEPQRESLQLACIHVQPDAIDQQLGGFNSWIMYITTQDKREIIWGHAPSRETQDEMLVEEKVARMRAWLQKAPGSTTETVLDLRQRLGLGQRLISTPGR